MQLGAREAGEGKARAWRVPPNLPSFLQPGRGKWDVVGDAGGEAAGTGCPQPGCSSDNKQVWPGECPVSAARRSQLPPLRLLSTETPGGHRSLCFLSWGSRAVWCLDQPCSGGGRKEGRICGLPTYIRVEVG